MVISSHENQELLVPNGSQHPFGVPYQNVIRVLLGLVMVMPQHYNKQVALCISIH